MNTIPRTDNTEYNEARKAIAHAEFFFNNLPANTEPKIFDAAIYELESAKFFAEGLFRNIKTAC